MPALTRALSAMTLSPLCKGVVLAAPMLLAVPVSRVFRVTSPVVDKMVETGWVLDWVVVVALATAEVVVVTPVTASVLDVAAGRIKY